MNSTTEIPINEELNTNFNKLLKSMMQQGEYAAARGMILAALQLAQAQGDAPEVVVSSLVVAYCTALDQEITDTIANAQSGLQVVGVSQEDVARYITAAKMGGQSGSSH